MTILLGRILRLLKMTKILIGKKLEKLLAIMGFNLMILKILKLLIKIQRSILR